MPDLPVFDGTALDGFGQSSMEELAELRKALDIGYSMPVTGTQFDSLRVESLESTLKVLTYSATHLRMWNMIPKDNAYSTVEEYNQLVEYGPDGGGFVPSGVLPETEDSTYNRANQLVKFLGTTRSVTHPATLVRTQPADLIAQETQNGALWLMGKANSALYYGNADANPLEWNGLFRQIEQGGGTVIDLQGQPLAATDLENAAQIIIDNFGFPSQFFGNPKTFTDFSKAYYQYQRFANPNGNRGLVGSPVTGFESLSGTIAFQPDTFIKRGGAVPATTANNNVPTAPTLSVGGPTGSDGSFLSSDTGNYVYQVTAINRYGESLPSAVSSPATVSASNHVPLTITDGGGAFPATGYKIYRSIKGGSTTLYTGYTLPRSQTNGVYAATTTWNDQNLWRPGTSQGLLLDMTDQSLTFKQLSPMIKMNLAVVSPAIRWMQLLYGTPIVYAPKKNVIFRNIGLSTP